MITQVNPTNIYTITDYCSSGYVSLNRMASRPKRRKTSRVQLPNPPTTASSSTTPAMPHNIDTESMIQSCMAQILPNIENTFRQYMENFYTQQRKTANPSTESIDVNRRQPTAAAQAMAHDGTNLDPPRSQQSFQTLLEEITSNYLLTILLPRLAQYLSLWALMIK